VQELADLTVRDIRLQPPALAVLTGKGGKTRHVPLGGNTTALLSAYLAEHGLDQPGHDNYPQADAAFVYLAARRLNAGTEDERRARLESALASWNNRLVSGTNFPGANAAGQGWFLLALGREEEGRAKLREALLLPDKMMSHYLSRAALAGPVIN